MVISHLDPASARVSVVVRGSCHVTVNVCGVYFSVVSERVPDAPADTVQMRDTDLQSTVVENASDSDDKAAHAANSGREDSWLTRWTDQATPGKGRHERSSRPGHRQTMNCVCP